jgi:hypothetical protein
MPICARRGPVRGDVRCGCSVRVAESPIGRSASARAHRFSNWLEHAERERAGRGEGGRPKQPPWSPAFSLGACLGAELPGGTRDALDRRCGSRGDCRRSGGTRTRRTRGGTRTRRNRRAWRTPRDWLPRWSHRLPRRSHRGRSTFGAIAGVLWITRTSVFAAGTSELGSGVTVRVHVTVDVRVGARLRRSRGHPSHRCDQRGRKYEAYQCLSHSCLRAVADLPFPPRPRFHPCRNSGERVNEAKGMHWRCASTVRVRSRKKQAWRCYPRQAASGAQDSSFMHPRLFRFARASSIKCWRAASPDNTPKLALSRAHRRGRISSGAAATPSSRRAAWHGAGPSVSTASPGDDPATPRLDLRVRGVLGKMSAVSLTRHSNWIRQYLGTYRPSTILRPIRTAQRPTEGERLTPWIGAPAFPRTDFETGNVESAAKRASRFR